MAEVSTVMNYLGITMCSIVGMSSKWIRTLTVLSLIFSLIAMGLTSQQMGHCFTNSKIEITPPVPACGGHPPPNTYCGSLSPADLYARPDKFNQLFDFWSPFVLTAFCVIFLNFLAILFHRHEKHKSIIFYPRGPISKLPTFFREYLQPKCISSFTKWLQANSISFHERVTAFHRPLKARYPAYRLVFDFQNWLYLILCILYIVTFFMLYILSTLSRFDYVDFQDWGIGQIIAVFVWVPVVAHWIRWFLSKSLLSFTVFSCPPSLQWFISPSPLY